MINSNSQTATARIATSAMRVGSRSIYEHIIIVTRETELEALTARFNTVEQARFYLEHAGQSFTGIEQDHARYHEALNQLRAMIPRGMKTQLIPRKLVPQFSFGEDDIVIVLGQDGLVVNTAKYLQHQPIIGLNPDPDKIEGVLLPFTTRSLSKRIDEALRGCSQIQDVTMAKASLNDGQELIAFNDLFVGPKTHTSARYHIEQNGIGEEQSSSGIIISTGAGSTGWMKSIYTGAAGIVEALGGKVSIPEQGSRFGWDEDFLVYAVREPWPSKSSQASMIFGVIRPDEPLVLNSHMADNGVIFSDGIESDYVRFNAGHSSTITIADNKARLIV